MTTRRDFLYGALGAGIAAPLSAQLRVPPAPRKLNVLILGGTAFLGPEIVKEAVARGHTVTLFNRGRTNPHLFPDLEKLQGDRDKGELDALKGREFDAVVDTSGYVPAHVAATAGMFAESAKHYTFVSSISVYPAFGEEAIDVDEDAPLATVGDEVVAQVKTIRQSFAHYGAMKALCEKAAETAMPGRVNNVRPGLIVGPGDRSDRFTWWPVRVDRGGEVLAPGDQDGVVQAIDVRDLGRWIVHCVENDVTGPYNAVGFDGVLTMEELLHGCKCATSTPVTFTWGSEEFLKAEGVGAWMEMPLWLPREGRTYAVNDRAREKGLTFRPIADTIRDTLHWAKTGRGDRPFRREQPPGGVGVAPEKEKALLAKLRAAK